MQTPDRRLVGGALCACVGNGHNDDLMFQTAALSIAVLETEGLYAPILRDADLLARSSEGRPGPCC